MKTNFKKTARIIVMLVVSIFGNSFSQAQPGQQGGKQGPPPMPNSKQITKMVDELATELTLSTDQKTKVSALYVAHFKEAQSLINNKDAGEDQRAAMDKLKSVFETKVKAVLTADQQKKYIAYMKKNDPKQGPPQRK